MYRELSVATARYGTIWQDPKHHLQHKIPLFADAAYRHFNR
jgi:hypothetical protein